MLDKNKILSFWQERGRKYKEPCGEMANLEPDPNLQALKSRLEQEVVFSRLELRPDMTILEPGAGYGQWAMRFAPHVKLVCAIDYADTMLEAGKKAASEAGIDNINFILSSAEDFHSDKKWDLIFVSGLFMYLDDDQAEKVTNNMKSLLSPTGIVFLRESASILDNRYIINDKMSDALGVKYSALYRTINDFKGLFKPLVVADEGWFFPEGSPLNKWKETRLAFLSFMH